MDASALIERIEAGLSTPADAHAVAGLVARVMRYELALRHLAVYGERDPAAIALEALVGEINDAHPEPEEDAP